jgi:hypothetical protein
MSELTLTNGQQLSVACGDGHVVTVRKLDEQRLSIKVERVEGGWLKGGWHWLKGWLLWLFCVYLSIVITLALAEVTGHMPALKEAWADVSSGQTPLKRVWADVIGQTPLKRAWAEMTGVLQQPVLKRALANLSQAFKK